MVGEEAISTFAAVVVLFRPCLSGKQASKQASKLLAFPSASRKGVDVSIRDRKDTWLPQHWFAHASRLCVTERRGTAQRVGAILVHAWRICSFHVHTGAFSSNDDDEMCSVLSC